jgi:hypothetical protein
MPAILIGYKITKIVNNVPAFIEFKYSYGLENALDGSTSISSYSSYPKEYAEQKFRLFGIMITAGVTIKSYVKKNK